MKRDRKTVKHIVSYLRDRNGVFHLPDNRRDASESPQQRVKLVTTHTKHKENGKGERYTIVQTAIAINRDTLAAWVDESPIKGELSSDGLTFTSTIEI